MLDPELSSGRSLPTLSLKLPLRCVQIRGAAASVFVLLSVSLNALGQVRVEESLERLEARCTDGDQSACAKVEPLREERAQLDKLEKQARAFQARVPDLGIQDDNVPNLEKAYPLVVRDYLASDAVLPSHDKSDLNMDILTPCAQHFHNFWINPRRAWPTTESGEPDWELIYVLIVDHYLGFCS